MQDGFLFDDNDPKKVGRGIDALRKDGDKLKAKWKWTRGRGAMMPHTERRCAGQVSEAEIGEHIVLEAVFWHTRYEARVSWLENEVIYYDIDPEDHPNEMALLTRVDAQRKAEKLGREFIKAFTKELKDAGL